MCRTKMLMARVSASLVAAVGALLIASGSASAGFLDGCVKPGANVYNAGGLVYGQGSLYCARNVSSMEVEADLYEHWTSDGQWHLMATPATNGPTTKTGRTILTPNTTAACKDSSSRQWQVIVSGWADINGTWYGVQNSAEETFPCRD